MNFYCLFGKTAAARSLFIGARGDVRNTSAVASAGVRGVKLTPAEARWERHGAHGAARLPS